MYVKNLLGEGSKEIVTGCSITVGESEVGTVIQGRRLASRGQHI
jgi:hypothetical protein